MPVEEVSLAESIVRGMASIVDADGGRKQAGETLEATAARMYAVLPMLASLARAARNVDDEWSVRLWRGASQVEVELTQAVKALAAVIE